MCAGGQGTSVVFRQTVCRALVSATCTDASDLTIREESKGDDLPISEITVAAFQSPAISPHPEPFIVEALRAAGTLTIALVATMGGAGIGPIAFSPVTITDGTPGWHGFGPVSVAPKCQRQGMGSVLILEGLAQQ